MIEYRTKLIKTGLSSTVYTIDATAVIGDLVIAQVDSVTVDSNTLSVDSCVVNAMEITVDEVVIATGKAVQVTVSGGAFNTEYEVIVTTGLSDAEVMEVRILILVTKSDLDYYGSVWRADDYFDLRLRSDTWNDSITPDKIRALVTATRAIDRLKFDGSRADADQVLQFPRGADSEVPEEVEFACYEEAISLLDGADPNVEQANLAAVGQGISSVRTTYDRTIVQDHLLAGITSYVAWTYLVPFLRDPREVTLSRV